MGTIGIITAEGSCGVSPYHDEVQSLGMERERPHGSGRQSAACRAHSRAGQRRNKRGQKMLSSPELDTAAA